MSAPSFVHLRLHTEYSLIDGLVDVKALVKRCAKSHMPAVAVTDQSNLFALVKFYRAAHSAGIKPIAGADVLVFNDADPAAPWHDRSRPCRKRITFSCSTTTSRRQS